METDAKSHPRVERYSFMSAALAVGAVVVVIGIAPRNERALFLRDGLGQAKAFAAVVPPLDPVRAQLEKGALDRIAWRTAQSDAASPNRGNRRSRSSGTELIPGTEPALLSNAPRGATDTIGGGTGNPTPGPAGEETGVAPPPTGGEAPGGGGGGVGPATVPPAAPGAPGLTVLPEPGTWGMMLIGFLVIGGMLRRPFERRTRFEA